MPTNSTTVKVYFGMVFQDTEPSGLILIPGTLRLDLPLVNAKGWVSVSIGGIGIKMKAEV